MKKKFTIPPKKKTDQIKKMAAERVIITLKSLNKRMREIYLSLGSDEEFLEEEEQLGLVLTRHHLAPLLYPRAYRAMKNTNPDDVKKLLAKAK